MIVSHANRFIFVHCRKVAGSSIKVTLAPFLGSNDIVIGSWNEIMRSGVRLNESAKDALRNPLAQMYYYAVRIKGKSREDAVNIAIKEYYKRRLSVNPPHPEAVEAKKYFPSEWRNYYKFAFVRNPFDRLASDYCWRRRMTGKEFGFRDYLELLRNGERGGRKCAVHIGGSSNWQMITIDGQLEMDFVGRYESMKDDFKKICNILSLPVYHLNAKEKMSSVKSDYAPMYGPVERRLVRIICGPEIEMFGYEYPY